MTRYQVYLETSKDVLEEGGYLAHIPQLIGCVARGKTKDVRRPRQILEEAVRWCRGEGP